MLLLKHQQTELDVADRCQTDHSAWLVLQILTLDHSQLAVLCSVLKIKVELLLVRAELSKLRGHFLNRR